MAEIGFQQGFPTSTTVATAIEAAKTAAVEQAATRGFAVTDTRVDNVAADAEMLAEGMFTVAVTAFYDE